MKTRIVIICLLFSAIANAQLNSNATFLKTKAPEVYSEIKTLASEQWEGDHEMMVYVINNQSDAFIKLTKITDSPNLDKRILGKSLSDWSKTINGIKCIDYEMVIYTYNNQIKAKSEY
jgi:hypothetical protein